jgi:hypothetical protein
MRWRWLAGLGLAPIALFAYACSTDSFQASDAGDGGDAGPLTQGDFCDAAAAYYNHCGYDAACQLKDLNNCGAVYSALDPAVAAAYVQCADQNQLECGVDFFTLVTQSCLQGQLASYVNDGGPLASLIADYCTTCDKGAACAAKFTTLGGGGYAASLFSDAVISSIDTQCAKKLDGGVFLVEGGTVTCPQAFLLCEYVAINQSFPGEACTTDGG